MELIYRLCQPYSRRSLTCCASAGSIAPGREFRVLAENQLEDRLMATPAVTGDAFILRSKTHLYRLGERSAAITR